MRGQILTIGSKRLSLLLALLLFPAVLQARERLSGYCERGGASAVTQGIASITKVQTSFPSCTVTVYYAASGLIVPTTDIYSDNAGTNLGNPFTSASDGFWYFYADNGRYNVRFSGVGSGIAAPFTRGDYLLNDYGLMGPCDASAQIGADAGAKIAACIAALPATGGTVDARGLEGAQTISSNFGAGVMKPVHLVFGDSTFAVTNNTVITLPSGSTVSATPGHTSFNKNGTGQVFTFTGAVTATATNLTAIVLSGAQTVTVASSAGFAVDDWVMVNDNTSDAGGGTHSELAQVRTVPGGGVTLTLKAGTVNAYTVNKSAAFTASVVKINVVKDVEVSGVTIDRTGSPANLTGGGGMSCAYAVNCRFTQNTIRNFDTNGIEFSYSYRGLTQDNWIGNSFSDLDLGGEGWAIQVAQSHFVDISHNFFTQVKELAWSGDSSHVSFNDNIVHGIRYGPNIHFNHGNSAHFQNNQFVGETTNALTTDPQVFGGIIQVSEPTGQSIISSNSFKNFFGPAIKVANTTDQSRTLIANNLIQDARGAQAGYSAYIFAAGPGITITGNQLYNPPAAVGGIFVQGSTDFVVADNVVATTAPAVGGMEGIRIKDSKYGTVTGNVVEGFSGAGQTGLRVTSTAPGDSDQLSIGLNTLRNNTTNSYVDATNSIHLEGLAGALRIMPGGGDITLGGNSGTLYWGTGSTGIGVVYRKTNESIVSDTADGADNQNLFISGGGAAGASRGAYIKLAGNEAADAGQLTLVSGGASDLVVGLGAGSSFKPDIAGRSLGTAALPWSGIFTDIGINGGTTPAVGYVALGTTVVGSLPAAAAGNIGWMIKVSDSTAVVAEGQACAGGSTNVALAFSTGAVWKCF